MGKSQIRNGTDADKILNAKVTRSSSSVVLALIHTSVRRELCGAESHQCPHRRFEAGPWSSWSPWLSRQAHDRFLTEMMVATIDSSVKALSWHRQRQRPLITLVTFGIIRYVL